MGTWDDGLYDNDKALDTLGALLRLDREEQDAARLVARIGLLAWMDPVAVALHGPALQEEIAARADDLLRLPAEVRSTLQTLLADPEAVTRNRSRTPEVRAVLGGYCDGPRIDALLRFSGAEAALSDLAQRAAQLLDKAVRAAHDLYQLAGDLAALGVLIELQQAGLFTPEPTRLATWYEGFVAIDRATKAERGFWWKYVRRVRRGFELLGLAQVALAPAPATEPPPRASLRHERRGPVERFSHPTFGVATLVVRFGTGGQETLQLRFADGVVRKIRRKFVTAISD